METIPNKPPPIVTGLPPSAGELLPLVYDQLRHLAAHELSHERPGQTLQATALVHEAWLRLAGPAGDGRLWNGQRHFFNAAADAMRRILIDRARSKASLRHGGELRRVELNAIQIAAPLPDEQLLALDEALDELTELDPAAAELVKLRYFIGLTHAQAAAMLGLSRSAADRVWVFARAWLYERVKLPST
jgi:RNA polymerase sigma factor (TIGR02999 family)